MKNYIELLNQVELFKGIEPKDLESLLRCFNASKKSYKADNIIYMAGDSIENIGVILNGDLQVISEDFDGNKNIMTKLSKTDLFGEVFVCVGIKAIPVTVMALTDCEILFINFKHILTTCTSCCTFHTTVISNMLRLLANKSLILNQKIDIISKRTTREKVLRYLSIQAQKAGKSSFKIPYSRSDLADFLCVDRSALSRELCKMQDEGLISFNKNYFEIN